MRIGVIQASSQTAQINNGNAISLPLGEDYTWSGIENLERTIEALFSEPFGQG